MRLRGKRAFSTNETDEKFSIIKQILCTTLITPNHILVNDLVLKLRYFLTSCITVRFARSLLRRFRASVGTRLIVAELHGPTKTTTESRSR